MVSIDNDVLSEVGFASESMIVWDGWLVDRPVVEWWVNNWILKLGKAGWGGLLLEDDGGVWSNGDVHVERGLGHFVSHEDWVHMDWHSLDEVGLLDSILN